MSPPLALVVSGAPLAARTPDIAAAIGAAGWDVSVVATLAALPWLDQDQVEKITGYPVRVEFRAPDQPKLPRQEAVLAAPATFNSLNKLAAGIANNYAISLLCESLGAGVPVIAAPMVNERLWGHPSWAGNLARLTEAGVLFVDVRTGEGRPESVPSGSGDDVVAGFDPAWLLAALPRRS